MNNAVCFKLLRTYNVLSLLFFTLCLISISIHIQRFFAMLSFMGYAIFNVEKEHIGESIINKNLTFDPNDLLFPMLNGITNKTLFNSMLFTLSSFIVIFLYKIIRNITLIKAKPIKNNETIHKFKYIDEFINNKVNGLKILYHPSRTFIKRNLLYISLKDLLSTRQDNNNLFYKVFHEISHKCSWDLHVGSYNLFVNKILILSLTFIYAALIINQFSVLLEFLIFSLLSKDTLKNQLDLVINLVDIITPIIFLYIAYNTIKLSQIFSNFRECYCDRYAGMMMSFNDLKYDYSVFNNSESVHHPSKIDRISCADGKIKLLDKVIIYYTLIFLLSTFPSMINSEITYLYLVQISLITSYILILFSIKNIKARMFTQEEVNSNKANNLIKNTSISDKLLYFTLIFLYLFSFTKIDYTSFSMFEISGMAIAPIFILIIFFIKNIKSFEASLYLNKAYIIIPSLIVAKHSIVSFDFINIFTALPNVYNVTLKNILSSKLFLYQIIETASLSCLCLMLALIFLRKRGKP